MSLKSLRLNATIIVFVHNNNNNNHHHQPLVDGVCMLFDGTMSAAVSLPVCLSVRPIIVQSMFSAVMSLPIQVLTEPGIL